MELLKSWVWLIKRVTMPRLLFTVTILTSDAIGTIVGRGGANIKKITMGEIPAARYDARRPHGTSRRKHWRYQMNLADPAEFIYNAIAPARIDQVIFDENDSKRALVVVPDNKLSLAIGRRGQNV